jgi:glutamate/aspartate transport system substrate-binding protein
MKCSEFHRFSPFGRVAWVAMCLLCTLLQAADNPMVVRTSGQEANLVKFDPGNTAAPGLSVEVMQAIERIDPGIRFVGQEVMRPVKRIDAELESGSLDLFFGLVKNDARQAKYTVIDNPALYVQYTQLAVAANDLVDVKSFDDIRALGPDGRIGVPQGSAFVEFLNKQGGLIVDDGAVSVSATLKKLLAGRIRFIYFGGAVLRKYIREDGLENQIRLLPTRFNSEDVCVMVSSKANPQIAPRIKRALNTLRTSGELARIQDKYGVRN